jgi:hypothetical protein
MSDTKRKVVLSLYDFTGEALKPWAQAGYECYAFDIQHDESGLLIHMKVVGLFTIASADLHEPQTYINATTG